ncbi:MAG: glycosyltransferase [Bryobacterales bacterium]
MEYLAGCIESVKAQQGEGIEVEHIVVDGGSIDGSAEFARAHGCMVMGREEPGVTYAINNKGVAHSRGELVSMLGCDDRLMLGGLQQVAQAYRRDQRPWIVTACRWLNANGHSLGSQPAAPRWITADMLARLRAGTASRTLPCSSGPTCTASSATSTNASPTLPTTRWLAACSPAGTPSAACRKSVVAMLRHGNNLSMQRRPDHLARRDSPPLRFAQQATRGLQRYALKIFLNSANPSWFLHKRRSALAGRTSATILRFRTLSTPLARKLIPACARSSCWLWLPPLRPFRGRLLLPHGHVLPTPRRIERHLPGRDRASRAERR